ncbi:MAG TPA: RraA family protein [Streptosporangiaceae bacterium]|nr:RraA family protein [Streptosporangiaceae bacterium]
MASEQELSTVRDRLLGLIDEERIRAVNIDRPAKEVVDRYLALTDLCSTVSDAMDELGIGCAIPACELTPLADGQRVCGPAITVRYVPADGNPGAHYQRNDRARLADRDLYGVGQAGDVAVFDCGGRADVSVMGGLSTRWAKRLNIAACIVDGGVRDVDSIRAQGLSVWSRGRTPITGKHRVEAVEINGTVALDRAQVEPGDLVVADGSGVCVVPRTHVETVLERCEAADDVEAEVIALIDQHASVAKVTSALRADLW